MSLLEDIGLVGGEEKRYDDFRAFLEREIWTDNGLFSFRGREVFRHQVELINRVVADRRPDVTISTLKGAQIGQTTIGIGAAVYIPAQIGKNLGYFLPTDAFAKRFDQTRFTTTIRKNAWLRGLMKEGNFQGANLKGLKEFRGKFLYTLGLFNIQNAISIPLDANLYDEVDVLPEENMEWSDDRIAASTFRFRFFFSVGMYPGAGIDAKYAEGCEYNWVVKCPSCGRDDQVLEDLFPACIQRVQGEWQRVCIKCGKPYDVETVGRWVAHYPERENEGKYSYRIPQLIVPAIALPYIMGRWDKAQHKKSKLAKFRCSCLAKPDGGDMQPITDAVLAACRGDYRMSLSKGGRPRFAGMDCGDTVHFACCEILEDGRAKWLYFEEMDSDEMVERAAGQLWDQLGISGLVIDSKPLRVEARAIAYRHPKEVWLQDFKGDDIQAVDAEHQGKHFQAVAVPRDDSLDEFCDRFTAEPPQMILPRKDAESPAVLDVVDMHLKNLRKEPVLDAQGNLVHRYVKNVPNHFGMAMNSALVAAYLGRGKFAGIGQVEYESVSRRHFRDKGAY